MNQWSLYSKGTFPREVRSTGDWLTVNNETEYLGFLVEQLKAKAPAHNSLYPASTPGAWATFWVDNLLLELDGVIVDTYPEMRKIVESVEREYSYAPRVYFSGNRSFHIYIDFLPAVVDNPMERLKILAQRISNGSKIVDFNLFAERHLIRVPYSYNEKSGHLAIGIDPSWDLPKISKHSIIGPDEFPIKRINFSSLVRSDLLAIKIKALKAENIRNIDVDSRYEWIEKLLQRPINDGRHRTLWHVVAPYLINVKRLSFDQAFAVAREYYEKCNLVKPLEPSYVRFMKEVKKQLKHSQHDPYGPWRLETIKRKDPQWYEIILEAIKE
jgi:hypothetical protein